MALGVVDILAFRLVVILHPVASLSYIYLISHGCASNVYLLLLYLPREISTKSTLCLGRLAQDAYANNYRSRNYCLHGSLSNLYNRADVGGKTKFVLGRLAQRTSCGKNFRKGILHLEDTELTMTLVDIYLTDTVSSVACSGLWIWTARRDSQTGSRFHYP